MEQPHGSGLGQNKILAPASAAMEDEDELVDLNFVNRQADDLEVMKNYYQENFYNFEKTFVFTLLWCFGQKHVMNNKGQKFHLELKCIFI